MTLAFETRVSGQMMRSASCLGARFPISSDRSRVIINILASVMCMDSWGDGVSTSGREATFKIRGSNCDEEFKIRTTQYSYSACGRKNFFKKRDKNVTLEQVRAKPHRRGEGASCCSKT